MKTKFFIPFLLLILSMGCTAQEEVLTFENISVHKKILLRPNHKDTVPYATIDLEFVYPKTFKNNPDKLKTLQTIFQEAFLGEKYKNYKNPQAAVDAYIKNYAKGYRDMNLSWYEEGLEEEEESPKFYPYQYLEDLRDTIFFHNDFMVSCAFSMFSYTGGAHGLWGTSMLSLDLTTLAPIKLSDVFVDGYKQELKKVIYSKLLEIKAEKTETSIEDCKSNSKELATAGPTDNFLVTDKCIYFMYNPYEIGPYSDGDFQVEIPYSEIKSLLKPEFMKRYFKK